MRINTRLIKIFMLDNDLTITEFCKICHISYSSFKKLMLNEGKPMFITIFSIAQVMNVNMLDLFVNEEKTDN